MVQQTSMTTTQQQWWLLKKRQSYVKWTLSDDFIPFAIETYGCFHFCFDSFFIACAHTTIMRHQWSFLVPSMLIFYYRYCMSITLQCAQAITFIRQVASLGWGSSSLSHIIASAPSSLTNLWQMTTCSS
jgi:hypothetical protein